MPASTVSFRRPFDAPGWRLLALLPRVHAALAAAWWSLIVARAALPAFFSVASGALVAAVDRGRGLPPALAVAGVTFAAINACGPMQNVVSWALAERVVIHLHRHLLHGCVDPLGIAHLEDPAFAADLATARDFDRGLGEQPLHSAMPEFSAAFSTIGAGLGQGLVVAAFHWWAAVAVAGAWAATHWLMTDAPDPVGADDVARARLHTAYTYRLAVDAPAAKELRVFGLADWVVTRFAANRSVLVEATIRGLRLRNRRVGLAFALVALSNAGVLWWLAREAALGAVGLGALVTYAQAVIGTSAVAVDFAGLFRISARPIPVALDLSGRMASRGALAAPPGRAPRMLGPDRALSAASHPTASPEIRFENVRFGYGGTPVLDGFDLRIPAGTSLAVVGANGAGKTTLCKLLCRLHDPQGGAVLADGTDLRAFSAEAWRSGIGALFQDLVRFELSLRDNVAAPGTPDEDILAALDAAGAPLPANGLDTVLSRRYSGGVDLSGGEWQRVGLARVLCAVRRGARLLVLDEPTAHLDVRGEAEMFTRVLSAARQCTTVLISHRFSTVRLAQRICVLSDGRVVELGSHDELMDLGGLYRRMFDLQAARFVSGATQGENG